MRRLKYIGLAADGGKRLADGALSFPMRRQRRLRRLPARVRLLQHLVDADIALAEKRGDGGEHAGFILDLQTHIIFTPMHLYPDEALFCELRRGHAKEGGGASARDIDN